MTPGKNKKLPFPDRRRRRRIVTLRNFGILLLSFVVVLAVLHFRSEMRDPSGDYGRLVERQIAPLQQVEAKTPDPILPPADPVPDQVSADPFLLSAAAREQILGVTEPLQPVPTETVGFQPLEPILGREGEGRVTMVGGAEGVTIVRETGDRLPRLGGGFMREQ